MATPLSEIIDVVDTLKSTESAFASTEVPFKYAKWGVVHASVPLGKDYKITLTTDDSGKITGGEVDADLTEKEKYLCGLFALRAYAFQEHHKMANKAVNFKTINFAVTGLTERSKEIMRIVWWCDGQISDIIKQMGLPMGSAEEMSY